MALENHMGRRMPESPKILMAAGDVTWHLGDRFIQQALVECIRAVYPHADIHCASSAKSPGDGEVLHATHREPPVLDLLREPSRLRGYDAVIWGGGQLLQDNASLLKNPYWATILSALRTITRAPIIGCGVGLGPLDTTWGRYFAGRALRQLDALVVRDSTSASLASRLLGGRGPEVQQAPDPATAMAAASAEEGERYLRESENVPPADHEIRLGIVVRRWNSDRRRLRPVQWMPPHSSSRVSDSEAPGPAQLVDALNRFSANRNVRGLFFPLYCAPWEGDDLVSQDVARRLNMPAHVLRLKAAPGVIKAAAGRCDLFLSFRMHGAVMSMGAGVPTVGVSYADKVEKHFSICGLPDHCLAMPQLCAPDGGARLASVLDETWRRREDIRRSLLDGNRRMASECSRYGRAIEQAIMKQTGLKS